MRDPDAAARAAARAAAIEAKNAAFRALADKYKDR